MNKQQAQQIIRDTFENSFNKSGFAGFIKNLLNWIDDAPFTYQGNYIPDAYKQYIKTLERIGKFSDGENSIDILVITLQKETSLERARTMQRNFIAWYLNGSRGGEMKDAALAAFVSPDEEDWRFSLVKMDYKFEKTKTGRMKVKEDFTPARRWSFLVGANEKSHTAQSRLVKILEDDEHDLTLAELGQAFDIETVTKEFFREYRELFMRTKEELDRVVKKDSKVETDFKNKGVDTVNFSKKLLGQIVFLYFLQKKGWFGAARDADWGDSSKHFLRELFNRKHGNYNNFFNDILEPLFYEALRIDRSHDDDYYSRFNCKIPFLNGGLFDPIGNYDWVHTDILLPDKLFSNTNRTKEGDKGDGILDIFDRYNFTVKEDEPLEKEVAIDPELLGKTYEKFNAIRPDNFAEFKNSLKSGKTGEENKFNKKFGVYYSPREIVHYMCQQSLINYLATDLEGKASKEDIEALIHIGEHVSENEEIALLKEQSIEEGKQKASDYKLKLPESIRKNAALIDDKLADITVCDPAVGSGAFPVGMMSEIVRVRNVLTVFLNDNSRTTYEFKRRCIEHSLYGVDIDPGAVEIAKLRLWLSLVVDEDDIKNIKPLPNLDYKIVCGNSLLGYPYTPMGLGKIEKLKQYFLNETNPSKKNELRRKIDEAIYSLYENTEKSIGYKVTMDFKINFSEVFHHKGGFDVVIANPPYVGQKGNKRLFQIMKNNPFFETKMDYWYFFLHKAHDISNNAGITAFITTSYWLTARGARKLRDKICRFYRIIEYINFNRNKIFEAGVHTNIFIFDKKLSLSNTINCCLFENIYEDNVFENRYKELNFRLPQSSVYSDWTGFVHFMPERILRIISKLTINSEKLIDDKSVGKRKEGIVPGKKVTNGICNISPGIETGKDRLIDKSKNINRGVFILTTDEIEELNLNVEEEKYVREFFKNSDIYRYYTANTPNYYLLYVNNIQDEKTFQKLDTLDQHFSKYKDALRKRAINGVLESAYKRGKWWALKTDRPNVDFSSPKIVCPQRSRLNTFAYVHDEWYASVDVYYITLNKFGFSLKYLLSILNSRVIYFWLYWMGKRKGENLELYFEPLQFIPIKITDSNGQKPLIQIVDRILDITQYDDYLQNPQKQAKVQALEREIDQLVYQLYDLTPEEIKIVKGKDEYPD